ncbi:hypothetical protein M4D55_24865 [Metabacillus idriensis]|uniref:hypothetical protein n=1 Tax=Metabacillus idriensis TaxID=324768 RepID=UPI00174A7842|nr:hypothetical protein [Metabacillus idriensis]MCM3598972.1 hypothetical protein [Metabacillus idriensis]
MRIKQNLVITSMSLDGHDIPVPDGLSDLLNRSGAWNYVNPSETKENSDNPLKNYERKVVKQKGKLFTYLTYKNCTNVKSNSKKIS